MPHPTGETRRCLAPLALALAVLGLYPLAKAQEAPLPPEQQAAVETSGPHVLLAWSVANEERVYGYLIYRSQRRQGPFLRINQDIVHARPGGGQPASTYEFVDAEVEPGATYYYYIDTVAVDGVKRRFSGVISKTVAPHASAQP